MKDVNKNFLLNFGYYSHIFWEKMNTTVKIHIIAGVSDETRTRNQQDTSYK